MSRDRGLCIISLFPKSHFASLAVRCRSWMEEPKVRQSMSSVAVANTFPVFAMAAHWASASHGAYNSIATVIHCAYNTNLPPGLWGGGGGGLQRTSQQETFSTIPIIYNTEHIEGLQHHNNRYRAYNITTTDRGLTTSQQQIGGLQHHLHR